MLKRLPKRKARNTFKHLTIAGLVAILVFGILDIVLLKQLAQTQRITYHGPDPVTIGAVTKSDAEILGRATQRWAKRQPTPKSTPTQPITPTPAPTPIVTSSPTPTLIPTIIMTHKQYGIAAGNDLSSGSQADLDTYFSHLKELGVTWVRWDFDWGYIQKDGPKSFNWIDSDLTVKTALKYGVNTLGVITYTPTWAQLSTCKGTFACAPSDPNAFGVFAGVVAARYAPMGVHHWEIWNEPNIPLFWKPQPDVNSYAAILKSAYTNIKGIDQSAYILSAGLSPASDNENRINPITFIQTLYKLDLGKNFDGIALHPYSYPVVASYPASWNTWQKINGIRSIMNSYGDNQKAIWFTEYGAPTGGPGSAHSTTQLDFTFDHDYMSEDAQAVMTQDAILLFNKMTTPVGPLFFYSLHDRGTDRSTPENFFGLMRYDWSKKPAYDVLRNTILSSQ